jgi:uncharacterized membrane protein
MTTAASQFNEVRAVLMHETAIAADTRNKIVREADKEKVIWAVCGAALVAIAATSCIHTSNPIVGACLALTGAMAGLLCYDNYTINANVEQLYSHWWNDGNLTVAKYAEKIFKNTIVARALIGDGKLLEFAAKLGS